MSKKIYKFIDFKKDATIGSILEANGVSTDYSKEQKEMIKNFNLDFKFINDNISIEPFYLFSESLANNIEMSDLNSGKDSIVCLTLCALAIIFEEPKEKYKKMFEELRLRGIYGILKPMVSAFNKLIPTFNDLAKMAGKEIKNTKELFEYTELFTPFMMAVSSVVTSNRIKPESLEVTNEFSEAIILAMKELDLNGKFKETVDKIDVDVEDNGNDIKKYAQFKDEVEMIQDDKDN